MQPRSWTSCFTALLAMTAMGWAAPVSTATNKASQPTLLVITSPKLGATLKGPTVQVDVDINPAAKRHTFSATLNGKDVTFRFSPDPACRKATCGETADLSRVDGLVEGRNAIRLRIKGAGRYFTTKAAFFWTPAGFPGGGLGGSEINALQPNYNFTTLTPGGYQDGQPWIQVTSYALVGGGTKTYPQRPLQCQGSVYLLVEIDRSSLNELNSTCLNSPQVQAALKAIPSSSFAVMGSVSQRNADWSNLDAGPIGGSDFRKEGDQEAPWSYMVLGIGKAPWSLAVESYNTGYERADAEQAQINGVLTANVYGLYDFHPSDNVVVNVDGVNRTVQINGVTYHPPAIKPNDLGGFWVLPITRKTLTPTLMTNQDNSTCPTVCGTVFYPNTAADLVAMSNYLSSVSWRSLIFVVAWGGKPGLLSVDEVPNRQPYTLLSDMGIPVYTFTQMKTTTAAMAALVSPDPAVGVRLTNRQSIVSMTPSTLDQHGQFSAVLSRDNYYLYRPNAAVQNDFSPSNANNVHATIDLSFHKTLWQPSTPWPMMDTPGRVNAYQYLSYLIFHNVWGSSQIPTSSTNDIRSIYGVASANTALSGVNPLDSTKYPFPSGGTFTNPDSKVTYTFTQQDWSDVALQLQTEMGVLSQVVNLFGRQGLNLREEILDNLIPGIRTELLNALANGGRGGAQLSFRINDVTDWTASMAGATSTLMAGDGGATLYGLFSGMIHAVSSSGLFDPRQNGIPDYGVTANAQTVANNFLVYTQSADEAYDAVFSTLVQDWPKLIAVAQLEATDLPLARAEWERAEPLMELAARRYFTSVLLNGNWQIDSYYGLRATKPSQVGSWPTATLTNPFPDCKAIYTDVNPNSWVVLPSVSPHEYLNDTFYLGGNITNNWEREMKEDIPPAQYGDLLFSTDPATGMPGLPKDLWFVFGPVGYRAKGEMPLYSTNEKNCTM